MKRIFILGSLIFIFKISCFSQENVKPEARILFQGIVLDANDFSPIANSQIMINRIFLSVSQYDGTFSFYVYRKDTVQFKSLGYKPEMMMISDTLKGSEFVAGIFMKSDTLSIGEVVIIPRYKNLRSDILNSRSSTSREMENARYNVAVSAYQGRTSISKLGDPAANYQLLRQRQKIDAYERGGIPSDQILGLNPLVLLPAAYILLHGMPEKPGPMKPEISDYEVDQIQRKYLETLKQHK